MLTHPPICPPTHPFAHPQEKSYFALRLPLGWWLFGFDLALVQVRVASRRA